MSCDRQAAAHFHGFFFFFFFFLIGLRCLTGRVPENLPVGFDGFEILGSGV